MSPLGVRIKGLIILIETVSPDRPAALISIADDATPDATPMATVAQTSYTTRMATDTTLIFAARTSYNDDATPMATATSFTARLIDAATRTNYTSEKKSVPWQFFENKISEGHFLRGSTSTTTRVNRESKISGQYLRKPTSITTQVNRKSKISEGHFLGRPTSITTRVNRKSKISEGRFLRKPISITARVNRGRSSPYSEYVCFEHASVCRPFAIHSFWWMGTFLIVSVLGRLRGSSSRSMPSLPRTSLRQMTVLISLNLPIKTLRCLTVVS